jgi:PAS domain S-box-containing protein
MNTKVQSRILLAAGLLSLLVGLFVAIGKLFDAQIFQSLLPGFRVMTLYGAIGFVLSGLLVLLIQGEDGRRRKLLLMATNTILLLLSSVSVLQYMMGVGLKLDGYVLDTIGLEVPHQRMAGTIAISFLLFGLVFLGLQSRRRHIIRICQYGLHFVSTIALIAVIGYWYDVPSFYRLSFLTSMAMPTAVLLLLLSVGLSFLNPGLGITGLFTGKRIGNVMARRTFPLMLVLMVVLGYFRVEAHRLNLVSVEFGFALFVISFVFLGLFIISNTAAVLNRMDIDRSNAEALVANAEANYHELFDKANDAIYVHEKGTGRIIEVNNRALEITGFSREELLSADLTAFLTDVPGFGLEDAMRFLALAGEGKPQLYEWIGKAKDGTQHWYEVHLEMASIAGKERILAFFHEIDSRKKAEEALKTSERRFKTIIEQFPYPVVSYAPNGDYITANKAWETMWEDSRENVVGYNILKDQQLAGSQVWPVIERGFSGELSVSNAYEYDPSLLGQVGRKRWMIMTLNPLISSTGSVMEVVLILQDVTERKQAEDRLVASEKRLRYTLDNMLEGAQIIGFDWRYIYVNDSLEKQGKSSRREMLGKTMMEKYPGFEQTEVYGTLKRCMEERVSFHMINEFSFPDGSMGCFELSIQPVPEGVFVLSMDVTERRRAEAEILKLNENLEKMVEDRTQQLTEANKALEAFSYSVSHDLRSPLRIIYGYADMLADDYKEVLDDEGKRLLNIVQESAKKMGFLIDDLLSFARLGRAAVKKGVVDMQLLVQEIWDETMREQAAAAVLKMNDLHEVFADKTLITQVFVNLISNAVKYSSKAESPVVEIGSEVIDGEVIYSVKDNGGGFDMQYADKLFGVFQRLHKASEYPGTGVGLAIVQNIMHKHGGRVWANSAPGTGATFYVAFPVEE